VAMAPVTRQRDSGKRGSRLLTPQEDPYGKYADKPDNKRTNT
jgi:hypothetical protein